MFVTVKIDFIFRFIVQVLYATPDQGTFYDVTDALEEQNMESIIEVKSARLDDFKENYTVFRIIHRYDVSDSAGPLSFSITDL